MKTGDESAFAAALKAVRWPSPEIVDQVAAAHGEQCAR
jgi:hypothetical protein